jgi:small subunit ribosomal protein S21
MSQVKLNKGESVDRALRRLRKKITTENTLKEVKDRRFFKKTSKKRYEHERRRNYNQRIQSQNEW